MEVNHHHYRQSQLDWIWYNKNTDKIGMGLSGTCTRNDIHMYIPVPITSSQRWYFLIMYWYTYGMEITNWSAYEWYTHTYILVPMTYTCRWYFPSMHWYTYGWKLLTDLTTFCVTFSTPLKSYKELKYIWVQIDTIYDLITNFL